MLIVDLTDLVGNFVGSKGKEGKRGDLVDSEGEEVDLSQSLSRVSGETGGKGG